ncbi:hypothetical protein CERSUDRAFT_79056 [Gelatoporia subvermispora B]|uniref:FYVE-type domain-containing protein n=1 Tax=Ceriporiopsis subvermispora (strain B) TaxID=914234 RepID=M2RRB2_CERS8|nr:hypothetical protein CERSUDRAFT_79056 [Gelatoporia subvermispora B]
MSSPSYLTLRLSKLSTSSQSSASGDETASIVSSQDTAPSSLGDSCVSSLDARSCVSEPSTTTTTLPSSDPSRARRNEHIAVLLPRRRWKPDSQATKCDTFLCRKRFSILERRHHCRKCGGVYCAECSSRTTPLLDTTNLDFLYPPRDVPISAFASPESPVVQARVCVECWDQIHGCTTPRSPVIIKGSIPIPVRQQTLSTSSSVSSMPATPPDNATLVRPAIRRATTSPRLPGSPLRSPVALAHTVAGAHVQEPELSLGELDAYPLRRASVLCKASGGGRWEPKQAVLTMNHRFPDGKTLYEVELEREEQEARARRANPILINGDFRIRVPRELEPRSPGGPPPLSTF